MTIALTFIGTYLLCFICWVLYLAVMNLARHKDTLGPVARAHAYLLLAVAYPFDIFINATVGTVLFLDLPREWVLTSRLNRYTTASMWSWRSKLANWIGIHLLNPFDPKGAHVKNSRP